MSTIRAVLNSSRGYRLVGALLLVLFWISITQAHRATYGDGFLVFFIFALAGGLLACFGTGSALPVARLVNGGAAVFVSGVMFAQAAYIAAEHDRLAVIQSLAALGMVLVANTVLAEARLARARRRSAEQAELLAARRHAELLAALRSIQESRPEPAARQRRLVVLSLPWHRQAKEGHRS